MLTMLSSAASYSTEVWIAREISKKYYNQKAGLVKSHMQMLWEITGVKKRPPI